VKKFNNGIVIRNNSLETGNVIVSPEYYKFVWNTPQDATASTLDHRQHYRAVYSDNTSLGVADISRKYKANGTSATVLGENIFTSSIEGNSGSSNFPGVTSSSTQETNFASSSARFNYVTSARNTDGGFTAIGLNYGGDARFTPVVDNVIALGQSSNRWAVVYAGTGTINTSDATLKQDVEQLSEKEQAVAKDLKKLVRKFRFKDAVEKKGDQARIHVGVIAQDVIAAFSAQGLDASRYGILCFDQWDNQLDVVDHKGNVIQKGKKAGSCYGVRYEEILAFIISAL